CRAEAWPSRDLLLEPGARLEMRASNDVANGPGWAVMLLFDPYQRDARVEKEAATLVGAGYRVTVLAWNRFGTSDPHEERDGSEIERASIPFPSGDKWR